MKTGYIIGIIFLIVIGLITLYNIGFKNNEDKNVFYTIKLHPTLSDHLSSTIDNNFINIPTNLSKEYLIHTNIFYEPFFDGNYDCSDEILKYIVKNKNNIIVEQKLTSDFVAMNFDSECFKFDNLSDISIEFSGVFKNCTLSIDSITKIKECN